MRRHDFSFVFRHFIERLEIRQRITEMGRNSRMSSHYAAFRESGGVKENFLGFISNASSNSSFNPASLALNTAILS